MTRQEAIALGFKELEGFTVMHSLVYDLGRGRELSFGEIGGCNECIFIGQVKEDKSQYSDLVCLHNYDYDGFMTESKLLALIFALCGVEK